MLNLAHRTPRRWVEAALENLDAVLVDHAHCEMKAATNALSLAVRASGKPRVVDALVSLAEEELSHFRRVHRELESRAIVLGPPPPDGYAAELRKRVRALPCSPGLQSHAGAPAGRSNTREHQLAALVDRLLVAALIEARSCERFRLLAEALSFHGPPELHALYQELFAAEARHFRTFVDLAHRVAEPDGGWIDSRLAQVASLEGELAAGLAGLPAIHG
jgi:tRNA-(ms[2]io[6]A)-hydroxylase